MLPFRDDWIGQERLSEPDGAKRDLSTSRPVQHDPPPVVGPVQIDLLIFDELTHNLADGHLMNRDSEATLTPRDPDSWVGHAMEGKCCWSDLELRPPVDATQPFDNEVDAEKQVACPITFSESPAKKSGRQM